MPGRVVELSAKLRPSPARFTFAAPTPDGKYETHNVARAGSMLLRILTMPREERVRLLSDAADDEVLVLFALLTPKERRDVLRAAEDFLKQKVTEV